MTALINAIIWLVLTGIVLFFTKWLYNAINKKLSASNKLPRFKNKWIITATVLSMVFWIVNNFSWFMPTKNVSRTNHETERRIEKTLEVPKPPVETQIVGQAALDVSWSNKVEKAKSENEDMKKRFLDL